jgi:peptidoglycan/LPS O-acetylase OafA/YrhL
VVGHHYFGHAPFLFRSGANLELLFREGWLGVELFFAISGYLLAGQLFDHRHEEGALATFYVRRAARIMPLYAVLMAATFAAFPWLTVWPFLTMTQNFWWAAGNPVGPPLWPTVTWSLAVEEQFYLVLPILIWLLPVKRLPMILGVVAVGAVVFQRFAFSEWGYSAAYALMPSHADSFALGILLAWRRRYATALGISLPTPRWLAWVGRRSYAIYLFHLMIGDLVARSLATGIVGAVLAICGTLALSELLCRSIEQPVQEAAKRRWRYKHSLERPQQSIPVRPVSRRALVLRRLHFHREFCL